MTKTKQFSLTLGILALQTLVCVADPSTTAPVPVTVGPGNSNLNQNVTLPSGKTLTLDGTVSGTAAGGTIDWSAVTLTLPSSTTGLFQPADADLTDLADGTLTGSKVQVASETSSGAVDTGVQTFAGQKTFPDGVVSNNIIALDQFNVGDTGSGDGFNLWVPINDAPEIDFYIDGVAKFVAGYDANVSRFTFLNHTSVMGLHIFDSGEIGIGGNPDAPTGNQVIVTDSAVKFTEVALSVIDAVEAEIGRLAPIETKTTTGDHGSGNFEGRTVINTFDNTYKVYAEGAWRTLTTW